MPSSTVVKSKKNEGVSTTMAACDIGAGRRSQKQESERRSTYRQKASPRSPWCPAGA